MLVVMLFVVGYQWGRKTNARPPGAGLFLVLFGMLRVFIAIALGG